MALQIKLSFLGAAQNVTGSAYLLEANGSRILIDCGLYQERELKARNWSPFPVPPDTIDALLLTHAHLDHSGLLPKLVRDGFKGRIHCTDATSEIAQIILLDSAHIQEQDAEQKRKRHEREGRQGPYPEIPLYTRDNAMAVFPLFSVVDKYEVPIPLGDGIEARLYDGGHVLGSSMIKVEVRQHGETRSIVFSGDVGNSNRPILNDPTVFHDADYVLVESTYGDRLHVANDGIDQMLCEIINDTARAGGNIVIPTFALERAQELLYWLNKSLRNGCIPHVMAFVDSPMATSVTEVYERHLDLCDKEMGELIRRKESPFDFPGLTMVRTVDESKAINHITGTVVIMAGSGMCAGGRIKYHLVSNITRPESTILFVGYQAVGTLGRQIVDGSRKVRILGQMYPVKSRIVQMHGLSGHADRDGLQGWLSGLKNHPPKHVFVTHGELDVSHSFASFVREKTGWQVSAPAYRDEVILA